MPEEAHSQAGAVAGPRDEPGDVGEHEASTQPAPSVSNADHAQMRRQGREWVVRDLGSRTTHGADQGALADVGETNQAHVGHDLELQAKRASFTRFAGFGPTGGSIGGGREVLVAASAASAARNHHGVTRPRELTQPLPAVRVVDHGAEGDSDLDILAGPAIAVATLPVRAVGSADFLQMFDVEERPQTRVGQQGDVPTATSVAAGGPTEGDVLLAAKGDAAIAAITGLDPDHALVNELGGQRLRLLAEVSVRGESSGFGQRVSRHSLGDHGTPVAMGERSARDRTTGEGTPTSVPPPSQRVAVVVNGNAKSVTDEVISTLDQILMGGDLFVSHRLKDCRDIAHTVVARGYGTVLTGGGDGTFMVMVTAVVHEARRQQKSLPRLGLLRLGTGNALAWVVGASSTKGRGLAADIQRLHQDAGSRPLRLIEVEDVIAPFCGIGADAVVLSDYNAFKQRLNGTPLRRLASGFSGYIAAAATRTVPNYILKHVPHCRVLNEGSDAFRVGAKGSILGPPIPRGEVLYEGPARIASMSTIPYIGFGFRYFPYAEERDDRMHLRVSSIGPLQFARNFRGIWRGEHHDPEATFDYLVDAVSIEMDPPTAFQIGGDEHGQRQRVEARLAPEVFRLVDFYAPPSAR